MRLRAICGAAFVVSACGGSAPAVSSGTFPDAPLVTLASEQSQLQIEVRTSPSQPPERGVSSVELVVKNEAGALQEGLDVDMQPWMPAMGHGAAVKPTVTVRGPGTYVLDDVQLFMAGRWELRTSFSGSVTDSATPAFDVP
jgi:hypothetical protein